MQEPELSRACEIVARKDAQPLRRALFEQLSDRTRAVRAARTAWEHLGNGRRAAAFVSALAVKSYLEVRFPTEDADVLAIWKYENERRQIAALQALDPTLRIANIEIAPSIGLGNATPAGAPWAAAWEVLRTHASRGDFLIAARVAETVGYYLRMLAELARQPASAVLVSSDTNPYARALVHAARRLGKRTCFVTHGHVAEGPPPLDFDLSILDGDAVRDVYERAGPVRGAVVFKGSEGVARPMDTTRLADGTRTLGIVLSILVDWRNVGRLLTRWRDTLGPERIVLRLHPNVTMRDPRWADRIDLDRVHVSLGERPLAEDVLDCDLVLAGNTSAHLTVLKLGVPTAYVQELDEVGADYYGFVRDRIVAPVDARAIALPVIARFYSDPEWPSRFARYDAGYPDSQRACDEAVIRALHELTEPRS